MTPISLSALLLFTFMGADAPSVPVVESVANGGLLFTDNPAGVSGTDAGYSLPLGRETLWLFGDVFLLHPSSPQRNYTGGVSNCALLVPRGQGSRPLQNYRFLTDAKTGQARPVIPNLADEGTETRLWPFGSWHDARNRRVYLFYGQIRLTGEGGPFGFRVVGHGVARAETGNLSRLEFTRLHEAKPDSPWWDGKGITFGSAVVSGVPETDPYLYLVGVEDRSGKKVGKMARVHKDQIENGAAYEYFAGSTTARKWSRTLTDAADVEGLTDFPTELSVAYNSYLGGYLAVHSVGLEPKLRLSLAPHPWGPYRQIGEVGAPHRLFEKAFCYAGKEHPELAEHGGRVIYVTYVDSQRYWLQLLKITLKRDANVPRRLP
jgi:hypothetical protein